MMNRPDNHEAKMARADLFKLAQYSFKLFKMINENQELEGWVQAKITKAADYIASVYHYMEYEMKVNEYGDAIENSDMYSETIRRAFQQKLVEAKEMAKKAKVKVDKAEKDLEEAMAVPQNPDGATAPPPKGKDGQYPIVTSGPNKGKRWSPQTPGPTNPAMKEELKGKQTKLDADKDGKLEKSDFAKLRAGKKVKEEADRKPAKKAEREVELPSGAKVKATKVQGWQSQKADKEANKERKDSYKAEAAKPDFLDMDKDGNKKEPMKKAVADKKVKEAAGKCNHTPKGKSCPVHGLKECGSMYEGSTGDYSAKKAAAGKDIGKPGKNFAKIEKSAGGGEKGKKIAGAVLAKLRAKG